MSCAETSAGPPDFCFRHGCSGDLVPWNFVGIHGKKNGHHGVSHVTRSVGGRRDDLRVGAKISLRVCCRGRGCVIRAVTSVDPPDSVSRTAPRVQESGTPRVVESDLREKGDGLERVTGCRCCAVCWDCALVSSYQGPGVRSGSSCQTGTAPSRGRCTSVGAGSDTYLLWDNCQS